MSVSGNKTGFIYLRNTLNLIKLKINSHFSVWGAARAKTKSRNLQKRPSKIRKPSVTRSIFKFMP